MVKKIINWWQTRKQTKLEEQQRAKRFVGSILLGQVPEYQVIHNAAEILCEMRNWDSSWLPHAKILVQQTINHKPRKRDEVVIAIERASNRE